ncbi:SAM-dependent methyltransferase [Aliiglaciecola sp. CAU 1673]|uniref:SAM-dependent methyltransferase n=1 Tax=Aliiglaciecola sp. CAU 1673 TaxID=3032595 RepID=UPI0023DAF07E|nr:SAM-dependent methyltransferase [Aliiglaciecola sp. CAU 1673]MDF2179410.1 SAM-dependent methyltransferase [Aliiglaciecola sp. CAU 1673]
MENQQQQGSIVCVGIGMTLGSHIAPLCRSYIEQADVVFCGVSNAIVEMWVKEMNPDVRSLQVHYQEGKDRRITYREMVEAMMTEVRAGKKVVGAFYGHPGVFAWAPHKVIEVARSEGYDAHMEPGVSAEDCLYADLGIDPGKVGCQHFEASQFMFYKRNIDASAYLILWQVGIAGDRSAARFSTDNAYRQVLLEMLLEIYPPGHKVALYEAPTLPIDPTRIDWIALKDFASVVVNQHTTMAIPPAIEMQKNQAIIDRLAELDRQFAQSN